MAVLIIVLFTVPILVIFLGTGDPTNSMEMFNLVPVRETFREGNWVVPTLNGGPRFEKPPLCVWLPAGLATMVGSDSLWVTRMPSVVMAVLTAMGTYGIGCWIFRNASDGRVRKYALFGALLVPAMFAFDRHARLASYDIYATAFAVGCAFFLVALAEGTVEDGRVSRGRGILLAVLAGVALGGSLLAKGPAPAATVLVPLLVWLAMFHRRGIVWMGVLIMVVVALLVAVPWVFAIITRYPQTFERWREETFKLARAREADAPAIELDTKRPWFYYVQIFVWVAPFVPLFVSGLCLPFLKLKGVIEASSRERRGRWLVWLVVVLGLVLLSIPAVKELRYAVQLLPFAALICAAAAQEFARAKEKLKADAMVVWVSQVLFFVVPAVGAVLCGIWAMTGRGFPNWLGGEVTRGVFSALGTPVAMALGVMLFVAALMAWRWREQMCIMRAGAAFLVAAWIFAFTTQWANRADPANHTNAWRPIIEKAARIVGREDRVVSIHTTDIPPWLSMLYYFNRPIPQVWPIGVKGLAQNYPTEPIYVLAWSRGEAEHAAMGQALTDVQVLSQRPVSKMLEEEADGRKLRLIKLEVPVLLIDASPAGVGR
jgi:4-amino-4-deoxy-L-arabinose transferase-like glycosyltransferase